MPVPFTGPFFTSGRRSTFAHLGLMACAMLGTLPTVAGAATYFAAKRANVSVKHKLRKSSHSSLRHADTPAIAAERATQIQTALIQKGYLAGEPSGSWDAQTIAAMQKLQADNGWQHKFTPDARALIKLGLGPAPVTAVVTAPTPR